MGTDTTAAVTERLVETMLRIRRFEDRVQREFGKGEMPGFVHTYHGAEAVATGVCAHLDDADLITSTHRGHGHCIAKGCAYDGMVAELYGRETGLCRGRGGSMHIADFERGMLGANAIVGGGISLAVGGALASAVVGDGRVAATFFGDGAANEGIFHESLNLAAIWSLPVLFVCENNGWAESTPVGYSTSVTRIAERAAAYSIPGVTVDGGDVHAVYEAAGDAVARARRGEGPTLIEAVIPRMRGHYVGDAEKYRPRTERDAARGADPVARAVGETDVTELTSAIDAELDAAFEFALSSPMPDAADVELYVHGPVTDAPDRVPDTDRVGTYLQAVHEAIVSAMVADERVIIMGEDIAGGAGLGDNAGAMGGTFGATKGLLEQFGPSRVRDTPISEAGVVGAAVGASLAGLRPIVDVMWASFLPYCFDQLFNQASKIRYMFGGQASVPIVLRMAVGAGLRAAGQHSDTLYAPLAHIPGLKVVVPSTPADVKGLLAAAVADDDPVLVLEHMGLYRTKGPLPEEPYRLAIGKAATVRDGDDVTIIGVGECVLRALTAADQLAGDGVSACVVDVRSISPLDIETLAAASASTGRVVVVDESPPRCSVASEIAASITDAVFGDLVAPVRRVTAANSPVPFSPPLEDAYLPSVDDIVGAVRSLEAT